MKLTPEQIEQNAAAYIAAMNNEPVELFKNGQWIKNKTIVSAWDMTEALRRPTPKPAPPKPWDCPEDVPGPVCWISDNRNDDGINGNSMVVGIDDLGVCCLDIRNTVQHYSWEEINDGYSTYSTDRKTWLPCIKNYEKKAVL